MGMLIGGKWTDEDQIIVDGAYQRAQSTILAENPEALTAAISAEPNRFMLIASRSCPWSHRVVLLCALKQLGIPIHFAFGKRLQGYALNGGRSWQLAGTDKAFRHLHQVYSLHDPSHTGRVTVPVLWDSAESRIISNESADLLALLDQGYTGNSLDFLLRPPDLLGEIERANETIYRGLNNAVYRAGFATGQNAYDAAVKDVFDTLDSLEQHLATSRYYFGTVVTETDLRLFPTLVRFDAIYAILFKCSLRRLTDYPNLWAYARDLFALKSVGETVDLGLIRQASYLADSRDPHPIIAIAPDTNWREQHRRSDLGPTELTLRSGETVAVDPVTLELQSND
ncbi:MAG: glutathione S-transferase C-terminal domain-containing protein [Stappiaceae bacterium]